MTPPVTHSEFVRFSPRTRARISRAVQTRLGLDPDPYRRITNTMLRALTAEEVVEFRLAETMQRMALPPSWLTRLFGRVAA